MDSFILKNDFKICYPILEYNFEKFIKKVNEKKIEKGVMLELRIDYLLNSGIELKDIISFINNYVSKGNADRLIVTIRTVGEGGKVDLSREIYFNYIKELYQKLKVKYIDVEFKFYNANRELYDNLFKSHKKKVIISIHFFDRVFHPAEYEKLFIEMAKSHGDIVKCAIMPYTENDFFTYMMTAKNAYKMLKKHKKECIFIAMGDIGKLSRIWPEFTNSKIVFLSAYSENANNLGQFGRETFDKFRNILAKNGKNW